MLEIGSGSGFVTACLAKLAASVVSIEIHAELVSMAQANLADAGIENVTVRRMDAVSKLPAGQFDVIAITASMSRVDPHFVRALTPGGRLFVIVGDPPVMEARIITCGNDGEYESEAMFETLAAPLENMHKTSQFTF